ncbi:F-box/kelch-repeat protein At3g23880-like [Rhododendron vialii]|uniref:F-box/kelch-repeat protein At3g23880-like n=1 Tax=Rhododendron vialii TaxID=182163 RepID=UPI0026605102|nr:F-box/kelch-repeat protein At3g23880-like [Rhododendron vialii]
MGRKKKRSRRRRRRKEKNNCTSKAESSFPNIIVPEEIIVEILSRLPLDSLTRFTSVSKQWCSLISDISVAKTGSLAGLVLSDSGAYSFSPHSIDQHQQEVLHIHMKSFRVPDNMHGYVMGSCNGLLLMHTDEDLFLWNPLTRFFKKVLAFDRLRDVSYRVRSGLCYDSTSDEYKPVIAFAHQTPSYGGEFVVVGSLKSKSWAVIHFPYRVPTVESGPIVNENLHWYDCKINDSGNYFLSPHQIIYFDARMDEFKEVPMPDPGGEDGDIICGLGTLDGCLFMFRSGNSEKNVELLVMKDYGVQESWTIMVVVSDCLTSSSYNESLEPLGYTKNGEILTRVWTWMECGWQIWAFNPNDNSHRRISIPEVPNCYALTMHKESLIIPTDYDWEEEEQKGEASYVFHCNYSRRLKKGKDGYWTTEYIEDSA